MSYNNFLSYLQQLLTMVDPDNEYSVEYAKLALKATFTLASISKKADAMTLFAMGTAELNFNALVAHRDSYIGVPGDFKGNEQRRRRLGLVFQPGC
jgi:hypothetical protein